MFTYLFFTRLRLQIFFAAIVLFATPIFFVRRLSLNSFVFLNFLDIFWPCIKTPFECHPLAGLVEAGLTPLSHRFKGQTKIFSANTVCSRSICNPVVQPNCEHNFMQLTYTRGCTTGWCVQQESKILRYSVDSWHVSYYPVFRFSAE